MINIFKATELLTSNLIYSFIMQYLWEQLGFRQALLLNHVNADQNELIIMEARGDFPGNIDLAGLKPLLDPLPGIVSNLQLNHPLGSVYQKLIKFQSKPNFTYSYLLFTGDVDLETEAVHMMVEQISYILEVKNAFDSLQILTSNQSVLKYQLNFFSSMINNVFEPFGLEMLIRLYMEIVSEMFLFPEALTLKLEGNVFKPAYVKGASLEKYSELILEAAPFQKNLNFRFFPSLMEECSPGEIGEQNCELLKKAGVKIMVPLSTGERLDYMVVCFSPDPQKFKFKTSLAALCNILNRALEMQYVKSSLLESNQELNKKLFSLTALYRAAEIIFANTRIDEIMTAILDIMMENYQSCISAVFLKNMQDEHFHLMAYKSVYSTEKPSYFLKAPESTSDLESIIIPYGHSTAERAAFLKIFPDFLQLEESLNPVLILKLIRGEEFYGFITLSERVTGEEYGSGDYELLGLLINSISLAMQNAIVFDQLDAKSLALEQSLQNLLAIQDVLVIIKQARNLDDFLTLLGSALELGTGVTKMSVFACQQNKLQQLAGSYKYTKANLLKLQSIHSPALVNLGRGKTARRCLVLPLFHEEVLKGCLVIEAFKDAVIEEGEHIQLLSIIANIISERFALLLEKRINYPDDILDFPRMLVYKLQEQIDYLTDLGLEANIVKFKDSEPHAVIADCREWAEGFVILPQTGLLVSHLAKNEIDEYLRNRAAKYKFIETLQPETIYCADL